MLKQKIDIEKKKYLFDGDGVTVVAAGVAIVRLRRGGGGGSHQVRHFWYCGGTFPLPVTFHTPICK